jgi:xanthine dehydrogenase accessory factor
MTPVSDRISELRAGGRRAAVATLVATSGGAVRRLGETMWVDETGAIVGSVTIGGCVDARTVEAAESVLRAGTSTRLSLPLGDEDAWAFGMTCAGSVDLLIEPVDPMDPRDPVVVAADTVAAAVRAGRTAVELVLPGSRPARLVVLDDATHMGSLGNAALDHAMVQRASELIDARASGLLAVPIGDSAIEVFVQVHAPPPALVIVGATDVAAALVKLASPLGFRTVVVDGRERWASAERFPAAGELRVGIPSEIVAGMALDPSTSLVLLSHDFKYDLPVLEAALRTRVGYIGVLGSRRRGAAIRDFLLGSGVSPLEIARVRVPVGLDIGARTAPEIALSVLAEVVATRRTTPVPSGEWRTTAEGALAGPCAAAGAGSATARDGAA